MTLKNLAEHLSRSPITRTKLVNRFSSLTLTRLLFQNFDADKHSLKAWLWTNQPGHWGRIRKLPSELRTYSIHKYHVCDTTKLAVKISVNNGNESSRIPAISMTDTKKTVQRFPDTWKKCYKLRSCTCEGWYWCVHVHRQGFPRQGSLTGLPKRSTCWSTCFYISGFDDRYVSLSTNSRLVDSTVSRLVWVSCQTVLLGNFILDYLIFCLVANLPIKSFVYDYQFVVWQRRCIIEGYHSSAQETEKSVVHCNFYWILIDGSGWQLFEAAQLFQEPL